MTAVLLPVIRLQQTQISSQEFGAAIPCQGFERRIGIDNRMVDPLRIDQHDAFRRTLDQAAIHVRVKSCHDSPPSAPTGGPPIDSRSKIPSAATAAPLPD